MSASSIDKLRRRGLSARRELDTDTRDRYSLTICRQFLNSRSFFSADNIACYLAMPDEVDTSMVFERAWRADKRIFAPVIDGQGGMRFIRILRNTRLERNRFGIWEPVSGDEISPRKLDVVVTPLTVFDDNRNRIGMGGGYFDRCFCFLNHSRQWSHPKLIGFAFSCQKNKKIDANPWDIRLYKTISEA